MDTNYLKPSNFFFYVGQQEFWEDEQLQDMEYVIVIMCPITFFQKNGYIIDKHLNIGNLLPDFMGECQEAMFDSGCSVEETRQELLNRGFKEDIFFSAFCKEHDPFV